MSSKLSRNILQAHGPGTVPRIDPARCYFKLRYGRSKIHRWGIFAEEPNPARRLVDEYTGERVSAEELERRLARKHLYLFWITDHYGVDGALGGSGAEFINHCCQPNLYSYVGRGQIFLTTLRPIEPGEELTYKYNLGDGTPCRCGAKKCKGTM
jgi:SET domain-containing protein